MRSGTIEIPVAVVLTQEAVEQMSARGRTPGTVPTIDGADAHGFTTDSVGTAATQAMLARNFLSKIEFASADAMAHRPAIVDLTKLVVYGFLYMRFQHDASHILFESEVVRHWNRANPARGIDEKTRFNPAAVKHLLETRSGELRDLTEDVYGRALRWSLAYLGETPDNRDRCEKLCRRFVDLVEPRVWYVLLLLFSPEERDPALRGIGALVQKFVGASGLADHFAETLGDLVSHSQRENMLARARMERGKEVSAEDLEQDEEFRARVIEAMRAHHEELHLVWRIAERPGGTERRRSLSVSILNREYEFEIIKGEQNRQMTMKQLDLGSYLRLGAASSVAPAIRRLGYLQNATQALGISFASSVREDERLDFSMITMSLQF